MLTLPPSLTLFDLDEITLRGTSPGLSNPLLPNWWNLMHNLREMTVDSIDGSLLSTMTQLERLEVRFGFDNILPSHWLRLTRLRTLIMGRHCKLFYPSTWMRSDEMVAALPRGLETLITEDLSGKGLPPHLLRLYLHSAKTFDACHLADSPQPLKSLELLDVYYCNNFGFPSTSFRFLPSTLRILRIRNLSYQLSDFAFLPQGLRELYLAENSQLERSAKRASTSKAHVSLPKGIYWATAEPPSRLVFKGISKPPNPSRAVFAPVSVEWLAGRETEGSLWSINVDRELSQDLNSSERWYNSPTFLQRD